MYICIYMYLYIYVYIYCICINIDIYRYILTCIKFNIGAGIFAKNCFLTIKVNKTDNKSG